MRLFICVHATYVFTARSSTLHHPINGISSLQLVTFKIAIRNFARKPASILCVAAQVSHRHFQEFLLRVAFT
uniref:Uncharacterized protein n=1 Tax=Wuchereria bancrofti TaxID=6293 RepID=A0A1I8EIV9_WUCBA